MAGEHCSSAWEGSLWRETHGSMRKAGPSPWPTTFPDHHLPLFPLSPWGHPCDSTQHTVLSCDLPLSSEWCHACSSCLILAVEWLNEQPISCELSSDKHSFLFFFIFNCWTFPGIPQFVGSLVKSWLSSWLSSWILKVQKFDSLFHDYWVKKTGRPEAH